MGVFRRLRTIFGSRRRRYYGTAPPNGAIAGPAVAAEPVVVRHGLFGRRKVYGVDGPRYGVAPAPVYKTQGRRATRGNYPQRGYTY
jgi:hypothetical protein